ncbi:MAG TPA: LytTR family DNA-binding domain-containing protein [Motilibacteraceae bacterium]|nr:LytTR family DNA-binding domain-containing protein [Motilibacteraceae bacterium]
MLRVLVADDEQPAREELAWLLRRDDRVETVRTVATGPDVLKALESEPFDAVFLDIRMPGLDGLDVARVLARFTDPPAVVFVTAYDDHAVEAFDLKAVDYLLKPVRDERLTEAVRRVAAAYDAREGVTREAEPEDETIAVELGGVTRFVNRSDVRYVEAHGDYARLHTATGNHLVRVPLTALEERWRDAGFVRIHRSHLVAARHIDEVRFESGRATVRLGDEVLAVSRRHTRALRDQLVRRARVDQPRFSR